MNSQESRIYNRNTHKSTHEHDISKTVDDECQDSTSMSTVYTIPSNMSNDKRQATRRHIDLTHTTRSPHQLYHSSSNIFLLALYSLLHVFYQCFIKFRRNHRLVYISTRDSCGDHNQGVCVGQCCVLPDNIVIDKLPSHLVFTVSTKEDMLSTCSGVLACGLLGIHEITVYTAIPSSPHSYEPSSQSENTHTQQLHALRTHFIEFLTSNSLTKQQISQTVNMNNQRVLNTSTTTSTPSTTHVQTNLGLLVLIDHENAVLVAQGKSISCGYTIINSSPTSWFRCDWKSTHKSTQPSTMNSLCDIDIILSPCSPHLSVDISSLRVSVVHCTSLSQTRQQFVMGVVNTSRTCHLSPNHQSILHARSIDSKTSAQALIQLLRENTTYPIWSEPAFVVNINNTSSLSLLAYPPWLLRVAELSCMSSVERIEQGTMTIYTTTTSHHHSTVIPRSLSPVIQALLTYATSEQRLGK